MKKIQTNQIIYPYLASAGLVAAATVFGELVKRSLEPTNLVMLYLLIVVAAAIWWGRGPAIITSVLSVVCFDFFLVPPYFTLRVSDVQYIFTFTGLLIVGLVISTLASRAREQALQHETQKLQTAILNSISHDLRTPLVSITGTLSALLQDLPLLDDPTRKELLETACEESDRLNQLVGNLLDMTRIESGALKVQTRPCELRDVIGSSLQQLKEKIEKRDILIHISPDLPEIPMDFSLMMRVFVNLVDNAVKYSPPESPVEITAKVFEDKAVIEIKDQGFGVAKEDLKRIFDKFYRAVKPKQITGTGLGLSICKGIVEAHGGVIWAENHLDQGTTFVVTMPLTVRNS